MLYAHTCVQILENHDPDLWNTAWLRKRLSAGLKEYELKDLAYTVFVGACGRGSHPELTRTVCNQLDVSSFVFALEPSQDF